MENGAIPFGSLNRCPLFWPKVHRFGHLSLEGNSEYESAAASRAVKRRSGRGARLSASAGIDPKMFNHHRWPVREMRHELQLAAHAFHVVAQGRQ